MGRIATLTLNPAVDVSCTVDQVVANQKLRVWGVTTNPGGGGINVARAAKELGGEVTAIWTRGGARGDLFQQLIDQEELPNGAVPIERSTRENLVLHEENGERQYRVVLPGPTLADDEIERCIESLLELDPSPEFLVLSGSLPPGVSVDLYARIAGRMSEETKVVVDTSGEPLCRALETPLFLVKPNIRELGQIAGRDIEGDDEIIEFSRDLIGNGQVQAVMTSLGSGGAMLVTEDRSLSVRAPTVKIRSRVGAGDSTIAGVVVALTRGEALEDAVRFGVAAGAAAVTTAGTTLCQRSDTEQLYEKMEP